jgi:hypothetical protein
MEADDRHRGTNSEERPWVVRASTHLLVLAPIRLALGLLGLLAAALIGQPRSATGAFTLGALGGLIALSADPRYSRDRLRETVPLPPGVRHVSRLRIAAFGVFPSTVGVSALALVALVFDPTLAALLAGILLGMALAGLAAWLNLDAIERRQSYRLYVERGDGKRVFEGPR